MQITRKISVSVFIDNYGHFTHRFSLIFIPSAVDRMSLNKQKRKWTWSDALLYGKLLPCRIVKAHAAINVTSWQVPMFVQFALPSDAMAAAADRPTEPERSSGQWLLWQRSLNFNVAITSHWIFATRSSVPSFTAATQRAQKAQNCRKDQQKY